MPAEGSLMSPRGAAIAASLVKIDGMEAAEAAASGRCTRLSAPDVVKIPRYLSSPEETDRFIALSASLR